MSRGSVRRGEGLLAGLVRCGHCGRKLHVAYSGTHSTVGRYHCRGTQINYGGDPCVSFGGLRADRAISAENIARLRPLGVQAALATMEARA
ncbi:zinc ribbon domain-containing protein [Bradyrhizobium sp. CCBAU 21359]|uniref:zinc ribbon domain-containing protein n=1 Tax=Bradyrhizobium sp. CCBAU 21359 TaxID=1325080 RepID=UPI002306A4D0|nr:zinc ribbon domain-containing protein [Bradyrhizobium sp. CCBAU 21359]